MSVNYNRIKVSDLETNEPDKILKTNENGELEFSDASGGGSQNLHSVLTSGNTTTKNIIMTAEGGQYSQLNPANLISGNDSYISQLTPEGFLTATSQGVNDVSYKHDRIRLSRENSFKTLDIKFPETLPSGALTLNVPAKSGTLATLDDVVDLNIAKSTEIRTGNDVPVNGTRGNYGVSGWMFIPKNPATADGYITAFSIPLTNSQAGRNVQFFVLNKDVNDFTIVKSTGVAAAVDSGLFNYNLADAIEIKSGQFIGCTISTSDTSNSLSYINTQGPTYPYYGGWSKSAASSQVGNTFTASVEPDDRGFDIKYQYTEELYLKTTVRDKPNGVVSLNSNGKIPSNIVPEHSWISGKKIVWIGTSIPEGGITPYPTIVGTNTNSIVINGSIGSSGTVWNGTRALSLSATSSELGSSFPGYEFASYENIIIGKDADLLVIDHGYNDMEFIPANLGTIDSMDRSTFYGSFNYIIDKAMTDNPKLKLMFITPPNRYNGDNGGRSVAQIDSLRDIMKTLSLKYNAPLCDLSVLSQINTYNYNHYKSDGIHPLDADRPRLASIITGFINSNF